MMQPLLLLILKAISLRNLVSYLPHFGKDCHTFEILDRWLPDYVSTFSDIWPFLLKCFEAVLKMSRMGLF
jgi:hypothetical protein